MAACIGPMAIGVKPSPDQNALTGIAFKIAAVIAFVGMASFAKAAGQVPAGQVVFFRSFFALLPIFLVLAWRGELAGCVHTTRPMAHVYRSMLGFVSMQFMFYGLARLPLPEATALNYAQPLIIVIFSAILLGEKVRVYRWSAVVAGFVGVVIVSWPKLTLFNAGVPISNEEMAAVAATLTSAAISAFAMIAVRSLVATERTSTIVVWFSALCSLASLLTIPFGWASLTFTQTTFLVCAGILGGVGQLMLTTSYRYAAPSTVAPFEYTSMILAIAVGYVAFGDVPTLHVLVGGSIVIAAGVFIILRERRIGRERASADRTAL